MAFGKVTSISNWFVRFLWTYLNEVAILPYYFCDYNIDLFTSVGSIGFCLPFDLILRN